MSVSVTEGECQCYRGWVSVWQRLRAVWPGWVSTWPGWGQARQLNAPNLSTHQSCRRERVKHYWRLKPERGKTLEKILQIPTTQPLAFVRWRWSYTYLTRALLPNLTLSHKLHLSLVCYKHLRTFRCYVHGDHSRTASWSNFVSKQGDREMRELRFLEKSHLAS